MESVKFTPPSWSQEAFPEHRIPKKKLSLARTPTPIQRWHLPRLPDGVRVYIKRDDLTGLEFSGNKIRKLEFILAEAKEKGYDSVVTLGGIQSNHARATAVVSTLLGLDAHLILRTSRALIDNDPGLEGNLMVERMVGAHIHLVTKEEYAAKGQQNLGILLVNELRGKGKNPLLIPVGGSSALGTWGYLTMVEEIVQQNKEMELSITDIASACGSGGTTAGIAVGCHLAKCYGSDLEKSCKVHGYMVCDNEKYFENYIDELFREMELDPQVLGNNGCKDMVRFVQAKGKGYALSSKEELETIVEVAQATGTVLDPVYTGKAVHAMLTEIRDNPEEWTGRNILFVHTGGVFGVYGESRQLQGMVHPVQRLKV